MHPPRAIKGFPISATIFCCLTLGESPLLNSKSFGKVMIGPVTHADRPSIYRMRHDVYATELGQHRAQQNAMLSDGLDENNIYITAKVAAS